METPMKYSEPQVAKFGLEIILSDDLWHSHKNNKTGSQEKRQEDINYWREY